MTLSLAISPHEDALRLEGHASASLQHRQIAVRLDAPHTHKIPYLSLPPTAELFELAERRAELLFRSRGSWNDEQATLKMADAAAPRSPLSLSVQGASPSHIVLCCLLLIASQGVTPSHTLHVHRSKPWRDPPHAHRSDAEPSGLIDGLSRAAEAFMPAPGRLFGAVRPPPHVRQMQMSPLQRMYRAAGVPVGAAFDGERRGPLSRLMALGLSSGGDKKGDEKITILHRLLAAGTYAMPLMDTLQVIEKDPASRLHIVTSG